MDELDDLVRNACRLIARGEILAAHVVLANIAEAVRALAATEPRAIGARLYCWLVQVRVSTETSSLDGTPVDLDAAQFVERVPVRTLADRFQAGFMAILQHALTPQRSDRAKVLIAKEYIDNKHHRKELRIRDVARAAGCGPRHLRRLWREDETEDTSTPGEYLRKRRIEASKPLLANASRAPRQIAFEVGYGSSSGFEREFKKREGMTPSEYRRRMRSQNTELKIMRTRPNRT